MKVPCISKSCKPISFHSFLMRKYCYSNYFLYFFLWKLGTDVKWIYWIHSWWREDWSCVSESVALLLSTDSCSRRKCQLTPILLLENPMDRETWWPTVHRVARVGHDLVTKPPPPQTPILAPFCATKSKKHCFARHHSI